MAHAGPVNQSWIRTIRKIMESENLLRNKEDAEILSDDLSYTIGFPPFSDDNLSVQEFWDGIIHALDQHGYKIVEDIYEPIPLDDNSKKKRDVINKLQTYFKDK